MQQLLSVCRDAHELNGLKVIELRAVPSDIPNFPPEPSYRLERTFVTRH